MKKFFRGVVEAACITVGGSQIPIERIWSRVAFTTCVLALISGWASMAIWGLEAPLYWRAMGGDLKYVHDPEFVRIWGQFGHQMMWFNFAGMFSVSLCANLFAFLVARAYYVLRSRFRPMKNPLCNHCAAELFCQCCDAYSIIDGMPVLCSHMAPRNEVMPI